MAVDFGDTCDGEILTISGKAPFSTTPEPFTIPGTDRGYGLADVTYSVCVPKSLFAQLAQPDPFIPTAPVAPTSSGDSGLAIIVVFALIAQLVVNVIAIRKPTRSRS